MRALYTLLFFLIAVTSNGQAYSTVRLAIKGEIPERIYYTSTLNGLCNRIFTEFSNTDINGFVEIKVDSNEPIILQILHGAHYFLIVEPLNRYSLEIFVKEDGQVEFRNENPSELQILYDTFPNRNPMSCIYFTEEDFDNYSYTYKQLRENLETEIQLIDSLAVLNQSTSEASKLLKAERHVYYSTLVSHLASSCNLRFINLNQTTSDEIFSIWNGAFSGIDFTDSVFLKSSQMYHLIDLYLWYKIYNKYSLQEIKETRAHYREQRLINSHTIKLAHELLPKEVLEYYIASYITLATLQQRNQKEREFIAILTDYESRFPNSSYTSFFKDRISFIESNL